MRDDLVSENDQEIGSGYMDEGCWTKIEDNLRLKLFYF